MRTLTNGLVLHPPARSLAVSRAQTEYSVCTRRAILGPNTVGTAKSMRCRRAPPAGSWIARAPYSACTPSLSAATLRARRRSLRAAVHWEQIRRTVARVGRAREQDGRQQERRSVLKVCQAHAQPSES
jgi:hypothetical protein